MRATTSALLAMPALALALLTGCTATGPASVQPEVEVQQAVSYVALRAEATQEAAKRTETDPNIYGGFRFGQSVPESAVLNPDNSDDFFQSYVLYNYNGYDQVILSAKDNKIIGLMLLSFYEDGKTSQAAFDAILAAAEGHYPAPYIQNTNFYNWRFYTDDSWVRQYITGHINPKSDVNLLTLENQYGISDDLHQVMLMETAMDGVAGHRVVSEQYESHLYNQLNEARYEAYRKAHNIPPTEVIMERMMQGMSLEEASRPMDAADTEAQSQ